MIGAVVLGAGRSQRMGRPKLTLPWRKTTVIGQVVDVLSAAGVAEIIVVTGGARAAVEDALRHTPAIPVFNPDFSDGEMSRSLLVGLNTLSKSLDATLVVLGDQPQIELDVAKAVIAGFQREHSALVVPSYKNRRGHPWLVARSLWRELLELQVPKTLRDFLNQYLSDTCFVNVDTPSVLQDLDTPRDYQRFRPDHRDSQ
jgi:molybdenum cofactor cytidylyltransferase